ncbi:MAG TPA: family 20 glycosylhydrolase [Abditibacteriaceae bacterium]|nr:family 20 glycosylhydrolase [Abditibacteriaceae bacterium]
MITLQNSRLSVQIDTTCGCDVVSVRRAGSDYNLLDKRGWQTWIKSGSIPDASTGVLSNFYPASRTAAYTIIEQRDDELAAAWSTARLCVEKTLRLEDESLWIDTTLINADGATAPPLQIEHYIVFAGGSKEERARHLTWIIGETYEEAMVLENFSQRYVKAFPFESTRLQVLGAEVGAELTGSANTAGVACVVFGKTQARSFFSEKFTLEPGEAFTHQMRLRLLEQSEIEAKTVPAHHTRQEIAHDIFGSFHSAPAFEQRWSHLCLQYDRVEMDDLKKLIAEMLVPLRYNGVIFETDRGVQLRSHPELAEPWSLSMDNLRELTRFCRDHGLQVGLEFNTPGHQNETNLLRAYPELAEDPTITDRPPFCVSHPQGRQIIGEVINELIETIQPDLFHCGVDEAQFAGNGVSTFGRCERCRGQAPARLFGEYLQWLTSLPPEDVSLMIFGDMFLQDEQFGPLTGGNGSAGEVWQALEYLPRRVQIADWHYFPRETYPSLDFFQAKGYRVWPTTAFNFEATAAFAKYAQQRGVDRILHTTWAVPGQEKLPIESIVWAAFYFWMGAQADELPVRAMALDFCRKFW